MSFARFAADAPVRWFSSLSFALAVLVPAAAQAPAADKCAPATLTRPQPAFEPNVGQFGAASEGAAFRIARGGAVAWLEAGGIDLVLSQVERVPHVPGHDDNPFRRQDTAPVALPPARLRLCFGTGAEPPVAGEAAPGLAHYHLGQDQADWRTDVPTYRSIAWQNAAPGVSVHATTHASGLLEYTVEFAAGTDPRSFELQWRGVDPLQWSPDGALRLPLLGGALEQSAPIAWQVTADGKRLPVAVRIEPRPDGRFAFACDGARPDLPLIVDPVLTYLGGSGDEQLHGVATDGAGLVYVAGLVSTSGLYDDRDILVSCLDTLVTPPATVWTAVLGGSGEDCALDLARSSNGLLTVVGYTRSLDFPTNNPVLATYQGGFLDGFMLQLDPSGSVVVHSTYFGGSLDDWCCRAVIGPGDEAVVAGYSRSPTLPLPPGAMQPAPGGNRDAFVVRLPVLGGSIAYGTWHGGSAREGALWNNWQVYPIDIRYLGLDVDANGRILLGGFTNSLDLPTANPYQASRSGLGDCFLVVIDPSLAGSQQRIWSTYLGGNDDETVMAAGFGPGGSVVFAGSTLSTTLAATAGAFQIAPAGVSDALVGYLQPAQSGSAQLQYLTRLGGPGFDVASSVAVDGRGHATAAGYADAGFPNGAGWPADAGGFQLSYGGDFTDGWVARIRPEGRAREDLTYGSFLGGAGEDWIAAVRLTADGDIVLAGTTESPTVPAVAGSFGGGWDGLAGRLSLLPPGAARGPGASPFCAGTPAQGTPFVELDRLPTRGNPFELLVGGAPPPGLGVVAFGVGAPTTPVPNVLPGALLAVAPPAPAVLALVSSALGAASLPIAVPAGLGFPFGLHVQAVWLAPAACLPFTSSAVLGF